MPNNIPGVLGSRRRGNRARRDPRGGGNRPQPATPILITSASPVGSVLTLTFDQPVSLNGTPAFTTDVVGATALSATQQSPTVVAITYSAAIAAATEINLGFRDPAIRNSSGGYVTSTTFPV